jgi:phosphoribosylaminoimidazole carboxylase PurK protein
MKNRIGIIGGGQLGRMMTQEAKKMGFYVTILDPTSKSPAGQVADRQIVADFNDEKAIVKMATSADFLTFEIENTNGTFLDQLENKVPCSINPSGKSWRLFQDKLEQKELFLKAHLPQPEFLPVNSLADIQTAVEKLELPMLLKVRFNAYDGRGNALIRTREDITPAWEKLQGQASYAEAFIPFAKELAVMIARGVDGDIVPYPVVETVQKNNICHFVFAPAQVSEQVRHQATDLAVKTMKLLNGAGVFGIEMFLTRGGKVLMNEMAPRVHNSGHYTIEACYTSQFEQHIRAITGLPLGNTDMKVPFAVMVNILGDRFGQVDVGGLQNALKIPGVSVHIYGKAETKPERKMGHLTIIDTDAKLAYKNATLARSYITL